MPHDKHNQLLQIGDRVALTGYIRDITSDSPTFCNVSLLCVNGMEPGQDGKSPEDGGYTLTLSARMLELAKPAVARPAVSIEEIRAAGRKHAEEILRSRSEFARHHVLEKLAEAFVAGSVFGTQERQPEPAPETLVPAESHEELVAREEEAAGDFARDQQERGEEAAGEQSREE